MDRKFQFFVSSTYADLIEERQDALKSILDLGHIPSGMEGFFAADEEQLKYIRRIIDECDFYILIIGGRYGSVDGSGVSYTEQEYEYAVSKGIPVLAFVHEDTTILPPGKVDADAGMAAKLEQFKARVRDRRLVKFWRDRQQLQSAVIISISRALGETTAPGWVRGDVAASEDILGQLNELRNELDRLRAENEQLHAQLKPNVDGLVSLDAQYILNYRVETREGSTRRDGISLTWGEIFRVVGPRFYAPTPKRAIGDALRAYVADMVNISWLKITLDQTAIDTISLQLVAYGFMDIFAAQSVKGGVAEFVRLTERGQRKLVEITAVKAS